MNQYISDSIILLACKRIEACNCLRHEMLRWQFRLWNSRRKLNHVYRVGINTWGVVILTIQSIQGFYYSAVQIYWHQRMSIGNICEGSKFMTSNNFLELKGLSRMNRCPSSLVKYYFVISILNNNVVKFFDQIRRISRQHRKTSKS